MPGHENFSDLVRRHGLGARARVNPVGRRGQEERAVSSRPARAGPSRRQRPGLAGDQTSFCRPFVSQGDWQRLRWGQMEPGQILDLHGVGIDRAHSLTADFLSRARLDGCRCVRLIHGKGIHSAPGAVTLKKCLDRWLLENSLVLAFCPQPTADGRSGAVDVLLKKARNSSYGTRI